MNLPIDTAWAILPFNKVDSVNPVLLPGDREFICPVLGKTVRWEEKDVFNPAAVVRDGKVYLLFRAEDKIGKHAGTSRIGLAVSDDGFRFSKNARPVLYPDNDSLKVYEWEGGIEDPRLVETDAGTYVMTYTAYDGRIARLLLATSPDLEHWTKHGTVLNGKYKDTWSKSGAIVARQHGSRTVAEKIAGRYWMYFGDTDLFLAYSEDLIHWLPLEEEGRLKPVLRPRKNYFDSRLVESGPFALVSDAGITLIYNGMNADSGGDSTLSAGAYCAGQALFDKNDPSMLIGRLEDPFMKPDRDYEINGQVNQVCFLEGMVRFNDRWLLYYGTADSKIAVAVSDR
ncbi:MAG: glycoside hydrolase family 130 protein [Bacteroidota bacterium]|nr:glycoside hydrolase family 130 protein [Bacteroidota bacterium]